MIFEEKTVWGHRIVFEVSCFSISTDNYNLKKSLFGIEILTQNGSLIVRLLLNEEFIETFKISRYQGVQRKGAHLKEKRVVENFKKGLKKGFLGVPSS